MMVMMKPPITPPAIAPVFVGLDDEDEGEALEEAAVVATAVTVLSSVAEDVDVLSLVAVDAEMEDDSAVSAAESEDRKKAAFFESLERNAEARSSAGQPPSWQGFDLQQPMNGGFRSLHV